MADIQTKTGPPGGDKGAGDGLGLEASPTEEMDLATELALTGPPTAETIAAETMPHGEPPPVADGEQVSAGPEAATFDPPPGDTRLKAGQMVDEYQVTGQLGEGGMGTVYGGIQPVIGKKVAIKVLLHEFAANAKVVSRFVQEARAVNQIQSRYIVDIFSFGKLKDSRPYFVMEFLDGTPLRLYIRQRGVLTFTEAHKILLCVGRGLAAAHGGGIVHRDLKPENIVVMTEEDGALIAKILDFGIAKLLGERAQAGPATQTGIAMGTPYYMSPEQVRGVDVDHRSDIYALGIIMFEMFTGALPFTANSYIDLVTMHLTAAPPNPSDLSKEIPEALEDLILRCIEKDPAARPQSIAEFMDALSAMAPSAAGLSFTRPEEPAQADSDEEEVAVVAAPAPAPVPVPAMRPAPERSSRVGIWILLVVVLLALGGGGAAWYLLIGPGREQAGVGGADVAAGKDPGGEAPVKAAAGGEAPVKAAAGGEAPAKAAAGGEAPAKAAAAPDQGLAPARLTVRTGIKEAVYHLGGEQVGQGAELKLERLVPGKHTLTISAPGHMNLDKEIEAAAGAILSMDLLLKPEPKKPTGGKKPGRKPGRRPGGKKKYDPDETIDPFSKRGR